MHFPIFIKSGMGSITLSSSPVFSRTNMVMDSERFYTLILDLSDNVEEQEEVNTWGNQLCFKLDCLSLQTTQAEIL